MKKIIIFMFIFMISSVIYSNSLTDNNEGFKNLDEKSNLSFINKYADDKPQLSKPELLDYRIKFVHISFAAVTYAILWAIDAISIPLIYYAFTDINSPYYEGLRYAHLGVSIAGIATFATTILLSFIKLGNKLANKLPIRKPHFVAAIVTMSFYVLEVTAIILSAVFYANKYESTKWVGLGQGITSGATTLAVSASLITIFF